MINLSKFKRKSTIDEETETHANVTDTLSEETNIIKKLKPDSSDSASEAISAAISSAQNSKPVKYWLVKSEPEPRIENGHDMKFGVDEFEKEGVTKWEGVRNYSARNILRDEMSIGDLTLFYHSNCKNPGVTAIGEIVSDSLLDQSAFDPKNPYFDPKSDRVKPRWFMRVRQFFGK
ncbi:hypothetical protein HK096_002281 [Nowakowskiella sp. JEL0078]|nr:hypothetical protein HK096_002281 [Nowakowskiella sp. JEL0078]